MNDGEHVAGLRVVQVHQVLLGVVVQNLHHAVGRHLLPVGGGTGDVELRAGLDAPEIPVGRRVRDELPWRVVVVNDRRSSPGSVQVQVDVVERIGPRRADSECGWSGDVGVVDGALDDVGETLLAQPNSRITATEETTA